MYIYISIYMNPEKKKLIYKVYTSIHIQFSTGRALSQRKEAKAPACLHVKCHTAHGGVSQVSVPLQSRGLSYGSCSERLPFPLGATMVRLLSPEENCTWYCFFKYMYLQCGWTAVVNQLLHTKKRKMALTSLVHLPALGVSTGRTRRDFNLKQK